MYLFNDTLSILCYSKSSKLKLLKYQQRLIMKINTFKIKLTGHFTT